VKPVFRDKNDGIFQASSTRLENVALRMAEILKQSFGDGEEEARFCLPGIGGRPLYQLTNLNCQS
jgi:hypothetical protein